MFDIKIINGTVFDGLGGKGVRADVGISGEMITAIGDLSAAEAGTVINAEGKAVAPGFIDMHTHSDVSVIYDRKVSSKIHDGVTTEIVGNCGIGVAPVNEDKKDLLIAYLGTRLVGSIPVKLELPWNTMDEYLGHIEKNPPAANIVPLLAHGPIRINEMGFSKEHPTAEQIENMQREIAKGMEAGCVGLSSGLVYMPGEYSTAEELAELCRAVAPYRGFYVTHIRTESSGVFEAIDEAIEIASGGGVPLHVSHLKLAGVDVSGNADKLLAVVDNARAGGLDMTFDVYPYDTGCTSLGACISPWAFEGGVEKMVERLKDQKVRDRIKNDILNGIEGWQNFAHASGGWQNITIATVFKKEGEKFLGKTIEEAAAMENKDPFTFIFDFLVEQQSRVQILVKMMKEEDIEKIISHPMSMIGSDGMSLSTEGIMSSGKPHPRAFGTRARVLARYVREKKLLSVEEAVKKMTSMPASRLRLDRRGILREGYFADVVIFDPATVEDTATYQDPKQYSKGFETVIVNGKTALQNGMETGVFSGRVLRAKR
ncbi:N-acyl-D-amino-acid deacylase family protein [Aminivibrio sp.]|jgi:N-acyl-D-amino-acid deacylase|uniref:N-acyl-D-amino-acid deacylase family protein n=1 Tax=Aminivibrio sp. TaxID=1872489 RepID=UPI0016A0F1E8|nr:D-aminoacylase [Synergistaceae bacterium]